MSLTDKRSKPLAEPIHRRVDAPKSIPATKRDYVRRFPWVALILIAGAAISTIIPGNTLVAKVVVVLTATWIGLAVGWIDIQRLRQTLRNFARRILDD